MSQRYTSVPSKASSVVKPLRVLPRGRHAAPREVVAESQLDRLLIAMADAVADKGYAHVAVADVIARAGVSRRTFYEHFANKEECFLAAYDAGVAGLLEAIDEAEREATEAQPAQLLAGARAATEAYLQLLADNPAFARTFLLEVLAAGPEALHRREQVHERFAQRLAQSARAALQQLGGMPEPPAYVYRAAVGAIHELVTQRLLDDGPAALPQLLGPLFDLELRLLRAPALTPPGR